MTPIRTILCPVDLSPLSASEVGLAAELAQALGARLVLHHNLPATGPGMAKGWEWKENHRGGDSRSRAEERMQALEDGLPEGLVARRVLTAGPIALGIERMATEAAADLVVLGCHGCTTEDHSSMTEVLLHSCACPILTLHEGADRERVLRLARRSGRPLRVLVPMDLSAGGAAAVRYALDLAAGLAPEAGVRIHLLHVIEGRRSPIQALFGRRSGRMPEDEVRTQTEARLGELVPEEMADRVTVRVEAGRPEEAILRTAGELEPDLIVMGEHARDPWGRLFTHDVAQEVLHRAPCPVWYVPPPRMAA